MLNTYGEYDRIGRAISVRRLRAQSEVIGIRSERWRVLPAEIRRALRLLAHIGDEPSTLRAVCQKIGLLDELHTDTLHLGPTAGALLLEWCREIGLSLTSSGLRHFARTFRVQKGPELHDTLRWFVLEAMFARGEPPHHYQRVHRNRVVLNQRTLAMLLQAERCLPANQRINVTRGSYETNSRKRSPFSGGGCAAIATNLMGPEEVEHAVNALRSFGFAAWLRIEHPQPYIHAIAIGDRHLNQAALQQVSAYFRGHDGTVSDGKDPHRLHQQNPPTWTLRYRLPRSRAF